ncbi:MAG: SDR family oxidoreductase [Propionibacteriaceae bacterium]|nr:SDR family oxidoreductase [Propionibacteriaceae bacterium]
MKTWFITGTSRGFGRQWAQAALERGDQVAATARQVSSLAGLVEQFGDRVLPLQLDVTDRDAVFAAVRAAHDRFGRIDVAINNAGYGLFGAVEEVSEEQARAQLETNFFGALWVTQAVLPIMRAQHGGHIIQVSSIGGITAFAYLGMYHASKWALEGMSQSLALEVAPFGIHVTLIEPAGYATDWGGASSVHATEMPEYEDARAARAQRIRPGTQGDPRATREAILTIVDAENPPLRFFLGATPLATAKADYAQRLATWEQWNDVSQAAQGIDPS